MTPAEDRFDITVRRIAEVVRDLRALKVPASAIQSMEVAHWSSGTAVSIHVNGATWETVALVDVIAVHYGLPEADPEGSNYARGKHLGLSPVHVFCGRPDDSQS